ncbi:radical SAM protein [Actinoplanes sp. NPDC049316]|uniref:radical SAM protein n=1 Tax=Actinoplanes sp. NPDC049316 TaxID=3154727 RepID=UPI00343A26C9
MMGQPPLHAGLAAIPSQVPSVDVYVTYRCDMRCRHCFVGDALNMGTDLPAESLAAFLRTAVGSWGTEEVSFLGGEPTLYRDIDTAIGMARSLGCRVRIVSNGGPGLARLLQRESQGPMHIALSFDGSTSQQHDRIRKPGSHGSTLASITAARRLGHSVSAILSVGQHNIDDALGTLRLLAETDIDYVNVHYVTNRGFATADMVAPMTDWLGLRERVARLESRPAVRFERTYQPAAQRLHCLADSKSMLMLFPDSRVFTCSMYLGLPDGNAFWWNGAELVPHEPFGRRYETRRRTTGHCPAARFVNANLVAEAETGGRRIGCIFDKELFLPAGPPVRSFVPGRNTQ